MQIKCFQCGYFCPIVEEAYHWDTSLCPFILNHVSTPVLTKQPDPPFKGLRGLTVSTWQTVVATTLVHSHTVSHSVTQCQTVSHSVTQCQTVSHSVNLTNCGGPPPLYTLTRVHISAANSYTQVVSFSVSHLKPKRTDYFLRATKRFQLLSVL